MRPDFRDFRGAGRYCIVHSAKGTTWDKHAYLKVIDGKYYYPDDYKGGRHYSSIQNKDYAAEAEKEAANKKKKKSSKNSDAEDISKKKLTKEDIEKYALEVIRGNYGNGAERKKKLGANYITIQKRVNELMKSSKYKNQAKSASSSKAKTTSSSKAVKNAKKKASTTPASKKPSLDMEKIYEVYRKKQTSSSYKRKKKN